MFVVLDGPNGSGKTTVLSRLEGPVGRFEKIHKFRLPGHSAGFSQILRRILVEEAAEHNLDELTRRLLYAADQRDFITRYSDLLRSKDELVLLDRWDLSTLAYAMTHGFKDTTFLTTLLTVTSGRMKPTVTIYMDAPAMVLAERCQQRGAKNQDIALEEAKLEELRQYYEAAMRMQEPWGSLGRLVKLWTERTSPDGVVQTIRAILEDL